MGNDLKDAFKKRLYRFILDLLGFLDGLSNDATSRIIRDQLTRSGTSILANYVEAQAASSRKDFTNFFHYALKSANESGVWLELLRDTHRGNPAKINTLLRELAAIANILGSSIITLKKKR